MGGCDMMNEQSTGGKSLEWEGDQMLNILVALTDLFAVAVFTLDVHIEQGST